MDAWHVFSDVARAMLRQRGPKIVGHIRVWQVLQVCRRPEGLVHAGGLAASNRFFQYAPPSAR